MGDGLKKNIPKKNTQKKKVHRREMHRKEIHRKDIHKKETPEKKVPEEWLYLAMEGVSLRDLYQCLKEENGWKAEYWDAAEVLEISIPEAGSVDLEAMEADPEDGELHSYMEETGAEKVYAVTVMPEYFEKAEAVMQHLVEKTGGIFCGDTEGFLPEIKASGQDTDRKG